MVAYNELTATSSDFKHKKLVCVSARLPSRPQWSSNPFNVDARYISRQLFGTRWVRRKYRPKRKRKRSRREFSEIPADIRQAGDRRRRIQPEYGVPLFPIVNERILMRSAAFNVPGVKEHAYFLKDISDARRIRTRVLECQQVSREYTGCFLTIGMQASSRPTSRQSRTQTVGSS